MPYWGFTVHGGGNRASLSQPPLELNVTVWLNFGKWQWAELRKEEQNHCQSTSLKRAACFPLLYPLSFWLQHDVMLLGLLQPCGPEQCLRDVGTDRVPGQPQAQSCLSPLEALSTAHLSMKNKTQVS